MSQLKEGDELAALQRLALKPKVGTMGGGP
jgi:hypothetical protein